MEKRSVDICKYVYCVVRDPFSDCLRNKRPSDSYEENGSPLKKTQKFTIDKMADANDKSGNSLDETKDVQRQNQATNM